MEGKKVHLQEGVKLAGSKNARDRTESLQGSEVSLGDKKQPQHRLVAILEWQCSGAQAQGATFGQQSWARGWTHAG